MNLSPFPHLSIVLTSLSLIQGSSTNWGGTIRQTAAVCAGQRYLFQGSGKIIGAINNCEMSFLVGGTLIGSKFNPNIVTYTTMSGLVTIPAGITSTVVDLVFKCNSPGGGNRAFFDDITMTLL